MVADSEFADWRPPWLARRAALTPTGEALRSEGVHLSYRQLYQCARKLARQLSAWGVREGDLVAILLPGGSPMVILFHALQLCGAVLLPLNTRLAPPERVAQLRRWRPRFLVCAHHAQDAGEARGAGGGVSAEALPVVCLTLDDQLQLHGDGLHPESGDAAHCAAARVATMPMVPAALRSALVVLPTSGSSGKPKGVVLGPENFLASALAVQRLLGASAAERWLLCMPLFHVAGLSILTRSCLLGSSVLLQPGFNAQAVSEALDSEGVTHLSLVPTMLRRLLAWRQGARCPAQVRCVLLGGAPLAAELLCEARALGYPVTPTYGLTEATSQVATCPASQLTDSADVRLLPLPGIELRVVPVAGVTGAGEIHVRGPTVMRGYLGTDGACVPLSDGWLATGDLGVLDPCGRLRVRGRRDDLIISGGENIYPLEIEAVLQQHPALAEACVVACADAQFGQRPVAYWVPQPGAALSPADLVDFCRSRLAAFKVPVAFHQIPALPRNGAGKVLRYRLRAD